MKSRLAKHMPFAPMALAVALTVGTSVPAHAETCWERVDACFRRAAAERTYWQSVIESLICEGDFIDCLRHELVGR